MLDSLSYLGIILVAVAVSACVFLIAPADAQEQTKLETESEQGTFHIEVIWVPNDLGRDHSFSLTFIEPETKTELEDIQYNFVVLQGDDQMLRRVDQISTEQKVRFNEVGPHTIVIEDIEGLGENASLTIQVTPEFPLMTPIIVALAIGIAVGIARLNGNNLFKFKA